jgi:phosphatidylglycerophosphatase A
MNNKIKTFSKFLVTLSYIGYFPAAPGTIASLATVLLWIIFVKLNIELYFIILVILALITSFHLIDLYLIDKNNKDPKEIVIDEFVGQSIPLILIPNANDIISLFLIFILFRFFDILKIYPINLFDNMNGSKGVMLDDIMAGIYTTIIVIMINMFFL